MRKISRQELWEIMCAPDIADNPQESDYLPRTREDEIADELFIQSWVAKRRERDREWR